MTWSVTVYGGKSETLPCPEGRECFMFSILISAHVFAVAYSPFEAMERACEKWLMLHAEARILEIEPSRLSLKMGPFDASTDSSDYGTFKR